MFEDDDEVTDDIRNKACHINHKKLYRLFFLKEQSDILVRNFNFNFN